MKKFLIVAATALLTLAACENEPKFTIHGAITEATDKMLYFEANTLDGIRKLDSVKLDKQGQFSFSHSRPDGPDFFRLRIGANVINLGIDSTETIAIEAQLPTMATGYTVSGSATNEQIKQLAAGQLALQQQINRLATSQLPAGIVRDSINSLVNSYKTQVRQQYIYTAPGSTQAYYALFQRINGSLLFNPDTDRDDNRCYGAVATSWNMAYPHSLRTINLVNATRRGQRILHEQERRQNMQIPPEIIHEVTLLDLSLPDMRGKLHSLTSLKGKVVLLDFTVYQNEASPARNMALRELYDAYCAEGFEIYQVSLDPDEHFWKTSADNLPWLCLRDVEQKSTITYHVTSLPTYFLIDRANSLYKRSSDIKDFATLRSEIEKLLAVRP